MRIVTLLPAATEIVALLAPEWLVGVSHECDYPAWVTKLPRVTTTPIDISAPSARIDAQVRAAMEAGKPVIATDAKLLRKLKPDLIITQGLCEVCAVADGEVFRLSEVLSPKPSVLSLSAHTIEGILEDIGTVGRMVARTDEAEEIVAGLRYRLRKIGSRPTTHNPRPRVLCIEWLDPLYTAGHWTPEMIALAGGLDVGATAGEHSRRREWSEVAALKPDIILVALCGFSEERARQELATVADPEAKAFLTALPPDRLTVIDGNAYTSRPGPRVVDGIELIRARLASC
ncbi:MAG: ABC transporter substrate-binding protein [Gemmatimonadales bacterium]